MDLARQTASYKMRFGLAHDIQKALIEECKKTPFSLNIDEATAKTRKKVLSLLIALVKDGAVHVHHLAAVEVKTYKLLIFL